MERRRCQHNHRAERITRCSIANRQANRGFDLRMEVASLPDELAHEGIAVLNKDDLENTGISSGSAITIRAGRLGRAIARTSQDADPGFVYLDATSRLNCSCRVGDSIEIERP